MNSSFFRSPQKALALTFGVIVASGPLLLQPAWSQETEGQVPAGVQVPQGATEAQVKELWKQVQNDCAELEATEPASAITHYQQFYEGGAYRYPLVAIQISLRIARIWHLELRDYDKALEIYDWALGLYLNKTGVAVYVAQLQKGRAAALEAQQKAEDTKDKGTPPLGTEPLKNGSPLAIVVPPTTGGSSLSVSISPWGVSSAPFKGSGASSPTNPLGISLDPASEHRPPSLIVGPEVTSSVKPGLGTSVAHLAGRGNALGWRPGTDRCITALARQKDGRLWVATEDSGVWCYDAAAPVETRWKQFTAKDGLGDDSAYAVAVDKQNRVWVGTCNHGVSVWNGTAWRNYDVLRGPVGERIYDVAVCPTDGDVWLATNTGLSRYSTSKDSWSWMTTVDGLPSDQIQALAFSAEGDLLVGTQWEGVAVAKAGDGYKSWRGVTGPAQTPTTPTGAGLPSALINDVLVSRSGTFYAATPRGLAWSDDQGAHWSFMRGKDYADKTRGRFGGAPAGWKEQPGALLAEDYVSCLAEDGTNRLWVGHWDLGNEVLEIRSGKVTGGKTTSIKSVVAREENGFVRALLPEDLTTPLVAKYDEGLTLSALASPSTGKVASVVAASTLPIPLPAKPSLQVSLAPSSPPKPPVEPEKPVAPTPVAPKEVAPFPAFAKAPTATDLEALLKEVEAVPEEKASNSPLVVSLAPDWKTQGDWLGRYGRYWACLCAFNSPSDYLWGAGETKVDYKLQISPNKADDSLRFWIHWLYTDNLRVLEMPAVYGDSRVSQGLASAHELRREAEVDDHGEVYSRDMEGPNIYASLQVPKGLYTLSLYNYNKDGEAGMNRLRDYPISVRQHPEDKPLEDVRDVESWPELAKARVHDFRGGAYTKFLVRGPQKLTIKVDRNYSYNAILAGIFLDEVNEEPAPYFSPRRGGVLEIPQVREASSTTDPTLATASRLWEALAKVQTSNPIWWAKNGRRFHLALAQWGEVRGGSLKQPDAALNADWWKGLGSSYAYLNLLPQWEDAQRKRGLIPAREVERALRWDHKSSYSGRGHETVLALVKTVDDKGKQ